MMRDYNLLFSESKQESKAIQFAIKGDDFGFS